MEKIFYFTAHPRDLSRRRLPRDAHVMLVASAHWDEKRKRFRIRRPPADHIASIAIDSGGFTAARRWDSYSWNWGKGQKGVDRPREYLRRKEESYSEYTGRLARLYLQHTITPRLTPPTEQLLLI